MTPSSRPSSVKRIQKSRASAAVPTSMADGESWTVPASRLGICSSQVLVRAERRLNASLLCSRLSAICWVSATVASGIPETDARLRYHSASWTTRGVTRRGGASQRKTSNNTGITNNSSRHRTNRNPADRQSMTLKRSWPFVSSLFWWHLGNGLKRSVSPRCTFIPVLEYSTPFAGGTNSAANDPSRWLCLKGALSMTTYASLSSFRSAALLARP